MGLGTQPVDLTGLDTLTTSIHGASDDGPAGAPSHKHHYMPGLDILRGLAILIVLPGHGLPALQRLSPAENNWFYTLAAKTSYWGIQGVWLFFVLSGFLITGILLKSRNQPDYYRIFYLRRTLRILPAYVLMLAVLKFTHWTDWRYTGVCLLYLANVCSLFHLLPEYGPLWSLSVEEQFYLVWPLTVRKLSQAALLRVSVVLLVAVPLFRLALEYGPKALSDWPHKTWGVADFFAAGDVVAILHRQPAWDLRFRRWTGPLMAGGLVLAILQYELPAPHRASLVKLASAVSPVPFLILWSGFLLWCLFHPGIATGLLGRCMVFIANISYGLYLCHQFIFTKVENHWPAPPTSALSMPAWIVLRFVIECALSILVAWISRYTLEAFFLRLKPKPRPARPLRPSLSSS